MEKKSDKKTMTILLIVLGLVCVGSAFWLYTTLSPVQTAQDIQVGMQIDRVYQIKNNAINNIEDFLDVDFAPGTIWDDLYDSQQFRNLKKIDFEINYKDNVGNPNPFMSSTTPEEVSPTR